MGLFGIGNKKEGGLMDVIRCDESDYLMWKWSPAGVPSRRENAIRYGSSLRVKAGEVAVFVYKQGDTMLDFIEGPFDQTIKTANFPVLSSIVGAAFGGASPFQAEIYFINLSGSIRLPFFVREFNVTDPRFPDLSVPTTVKGAITFSITHYREFIGKYRMTGYDMDDLSQQIREVVTRYVKSAVTNAPFQLQMPVTQIERGIDQISTTVEGRLKTTLAEDFAVNMRRLDISDIAVDMQSDGYRQLRALGAEQTSTMSMQYEVNRRNLVDQQAIGAENLAESLRIQREETQRAQRLQTESANLTAHQIDVQAEVARTAAESLGQMSGGMGMGGDGGMNPGGMMAGMMMGGAVGGSMANMMGSAMQGINTPQPPSPPAAAIAQWHVAENGQQAGPFTLVQLQQQVQAGSLTPATYVWKPGMGAWALAGEVAELGALFGAVPPPMPPVPPVPPAL